MGIAWEVYIAEVGQISSCELLHKFRKPEAVFQISQVWIITAPGKRNQSRKRMFYQQPL